ncbi:hypothetical protein NUACC21_02530 [Scytonema sp. NUACC21]
MKRDNEQIKDRIHANAQPNFADFGRVAVRGAVIGGSIRFATKLYVKYKEGKNVFKGELTLEDWKEIGFDTATGAALSSISETAIYGLTNFAQMSAPLAGAFVSRRLNKLRLYAASKEKTVTQIVEDWVDRLPNTEIGNPVTVPTPSFPDGENWSKDAT